MMDWDVERVLLFSMFLLLFISGLCETQNRNLCHRKPLICLPLS
jgi:hypothetical protein